MISVIQDQLPVGLLVEIDSKVSNSELMIVITILQMYILVGMSCSVMHVCIYIYVDHN